MHTQNNGKNIKRKYIKILTGVIFAIEFLLTFTFFFMLSEFYEITSVFNT